MPSLSYHDSFTPEASEAGQDKMSQGHKQRNIFPTLGGDESYISLKILRNVWFKPTQQEAVLEECHMQNTDKLNAPTQMCHL